MKARHMAIFYTKAIGNLLYQSIGHNMDKRGQNSGPVKSSLIVYLLQNVVIKGFTNDTLWSSVSF